MTPLPITILLPTRNSISLLPEHLRNLAPLLPMAEAVIHVDSQSTDGTVEAVQNGLRHPNYQFFDRPPGLYQSWNFGIGQITSKYFYVSTIGETLEARGLRRLLEVAESFEADAVVSVPRFLSELGEAVEMEWPIHRMISQLGLKMPALLPSQLAFVLAVQLIPNAILNSSASNLYLTRTFQQRPFPLDFGTAGDSGWGLLHALGTRIAVAPECFSTFLIHEKSYSLKPYQVENICSKMYRLAIDTLAAHGGDVNLPELVRANFQSIRNYHEAQERLESYRDKGWKSPWILSPGAWKTRAFRNASRRQMRATTAEIISRHEELGMKVRRLGEPVTVGPAA